MVVGKLPLPSAVDAAGAPSSAAAASAPLAAAAAAAQRQRREALGGPVLVCAQSNVAVDNLLEALSALGVRALRIGQPAKVRPISPCVVACPRRAFHSTWCSRLLHGARPLGSSQGVEGFSSSGTCLVQRDEGRAAWCARSERRRGGRAVRVWRVEVVCADRCRGIEQRRGGRVPRTSGVHGPQVRGELRGATLDARVERHPRQAEALELSGRLRAHRQRLPSLRGRDRGLGHRDANIMARELRDLQAAITQSVRPALPPPLSRACMVCLRGGIYVPAARRGAHESGRGVLAAADAAGAADAGWLRALVLTPASCCRFTQPRRPAALRPRPAPSACRRRASQGSGGLAERWPLGLAGRAMTSAVLLSRCFCMGQVLEDADVICATCVGAGSELLQDVRFPLVVLDEGSQATEPECLIPLTKVRAWGCVLGAPGRIGGMRCLRYRFAGDWEHQVHDTLRGAAFPESRCAALQSSKGLFAVAEGQLPREREAPTWKHAAPATAGLLIQQRSTSCAQ